MTDPTNRDRSDRIGYIVQTIPPYKDDPESAVVGILSDLMHYCDQNEIDYDQAFDIARLHYQEELYNAE